MDTSACWNSQDNAHSHRECICVLSEHVKVIKVLVPANPTE